MFPGLGRQDARDPKKQTVPFPKMTQESSTSRWRRMAAR